MNAPSQEQLQSLLIRDPFIENKETLRGCEQEDELFRRLFAPNSFGSPFLRSQGTFSPALVSTTKFFKEIENLDALTNTAAALIPDKPSLVSMVKPLSEHNFLWPFKEGKSDCLVSSRNQVLFELPRKNNHSNEEFPRRYSEVEEPAESFPYITTATVTDVQWNASKCIESERINNQVISARAVENLVQVRDARGRNPFGDHIAGIQRPVTYSTWQPLDSSIGVSSVSGSAVSLQDIEVPPDDLVNSRCMSVSSFDGFHRNGVTNLPLRKSKTYDITLTPELQFHFRSRVRELKDLLPLGFRTASLVSQVSVLAAVKDYIGFLKEDNVNLVNKIEKSSSFE